MQFTQLHTHFVVIFIEVHYKEFAMGNIIKWMISKVGPVLLIMWRQHGYYNCKPKSSRFTMCPH